MLEATKQLIGREKKGNSQLRFSRLFIAPLRTAVKSANVNVLRRVFWLLKKAPKMEELVDSENREGNHHDAEGRSNNEILIEPPPTLERNEDVSTRFKKTEQISSGTSESFWAVDSETGETYYCKTEKDPNKLKAEILANLIYRECGIPVPAQQIIIYEDKEWIASRKIVNAEACNLGQLEENKHQIQNGFVVDALLANRDVFGLISNPNILRKEDIFYRLDGGGALDYRGRHGKKHFSTIGCPEIDSMRDEQYLTGKVFSDVTDKLISKQVKLILETLTTNRVAELVFKSGIKNPNKYIDSIMSRIRYLQERFLSDQYTEDMRLLTSENVFPEKVKRDIENLKLRFETAIKNLTNFEKINERKFSEIKKIKENEKPEFFDDDYLEFSGDFITRVELIDALESISLSREESYVSTELMCQEVLDLKEEYHTLLNKIKEKINFTTTRFNAIDFMKTLKRSIEVDSIKISEQISSHVTGYNDLVSILKNGRLLSKGAQLKENGHYNAKITSKADKELHQIVFDRRTFRPEYSAPEHMSKVPPVIFMTPSSFLLSEYQGMESDGWHAFDKNYDLGSNTGDNFSLDIGNQNLVIMVPIEYQNQLRIELRSMTIENESVAELESRMKIVYIPLETYKNKKNGKLYSSQDYQRKPELKKRIYDLAKDHLPKQKLKRGRLLPTGNTGNGSATYDKKLYQYIMAR